MFPAYIFDIDGVLADNTHRQHLIEQEPKQWQKFLDLSYKDDAYALTVDLLNRLKESGMKIILCTGRAEKYRQMTEDWLKRHNVRYDYLFMRPDKEIYTHNAQIKQDCYYKHIKDNFAVMGVFEDRNRCVEMWRKLGLTCYQPREGNF